MPCHADWTDDTLTLVFAGHVSAIEVARMVAAIHGDARFENVRYQLFDATLATSTDFSADRAVENAYLDSVLNGVNQRHRTAFVATEPAIVLAMTTYIGILDELDPGIERRLFDRRDDAVAWLHALRPDQIPSALVSGKRTRQ